LSAAVYTSANYLRPKAPSFTACFRRLERAAAEHGGEIPAAWTLERRLRALPEALRALFRDGSTQQRDRGMFHALEAVNVDGYKWDAFVAIELLPYA
jgi:putative transposase